ncbi:hypothetical protein NEFER03_0688 [Nematocida sp. LUAm3]|nr:hypothetical protein NEFER03_0688 [Nematocida sp. LUAm3]KAI5175147.1 hypothetical protein NEFER02_1108 [Nematocida sp. LUAm2]
MDKKKRYAWVELFREENSTVTYDHFAVKECFNEFFEGVMEIDKGKDIARYYKVSLHLIIFLKVQKEIKNDIQRALTEEEREILQMNPKELFWKVTMKMPSAFVFSKIPSISVPNEMIENIREILNEIVLVRRRISSPIDETYLSILFRALRGETTQSAKTFREDKFDLFTIQSVFRLLLKLKGNKVLNSFYLRYEMLYFLNVYCRQRFKTVSFPFFKEDIQFLHTDGSDGILPQPSTSVEEYDIRITDRKFIIITYANIMRISRKFELSKEMEYHLLAVLRTFLLKEEFLGYFQDYSTEILIISFTYITMCVHKKKVSPHKVHRVYYDIGHIVPFCLVKEGDLSITIEDIIVQSIVPTYNSLITSIMYNKGGKKETRPLSHPSTPKKKEPPQSTKYILSPLSGRMSQIIPAESAPQRKLFHNTPHNAPHNTPSPTEHGTPPHNT